MMNTDELIRLITPNHKQLFTAFKDPRFRPPILEEMWDDINHVISSIASRYTDQSCPQLHFEDLQSEGKRKLSELVHKGFLEALPKNPNPTRYEFFAVFKTAVNNHIKGLVHKHRGTVKRTGHRIPTKEERSNPTFIHESTKPIEISLDDPDSHLQLSEPEDTGNMEARELLEDIGSRLTPLELLVLNQLLNPNDNAYFYATLDMLQSRKADPSKLRVKYAHMAAGLGISLDLFLSAQKSIQQKYMSSEREQTDGQQLKFNSALATLSQVFLVQVPDSIAQERETVSRLFTMAARRESEKVTEDVKQLLLVVGAKPPELKTSTLDNCFGVMFEQGHKTCSTCGVNGACELEAHEHGIDGTVRYSPKLLGAKTVRIPVLVPNRMHSTPVAAPLVTAIADEENIGERDEEIGVFIAENFTQVSCKGEVFFKHKDPRPDGKVRYIFWVNKMPNTKLQVRFCNPSGPLRDKLQREKNGYYLPATLQPPEAVKLINIHARETF